MFFAFVKKNLFNQSTFRTGTLRFYVNTKFLKLALGISGTYPSDTCKKRYDTNQILREYLEHLSTIPIFLYVMSFILSLRKKALKTRQSSSSRRLRPHSQGVQGVGPQGLGESKSRPIGPQGVKGKADRVPGGHGVGLQVPRWLGS